MHNLKVQQACSTIEQRKLELFPLELHHHHLRLSTPTPYPNLPLKTRITGDGYGGGCELLAAKNDECIRT